VSAVDLDYYNETARLWRFVNLDYHNETEQV
jgi:hypothetical protein